MKEYDIALLDFGQDKRKQPVFNKHIRPICMASGLKTNGKSIVDSLLQSGHLCRRVYSFRRSGHMMVACSLVL